MRAPTAPALNTTPEDIAHFLQAKIGYHDDDTNKNYGMCVSVLNKCQDYSYNTKNNKKQFIFDNQVIQQYLYRTLMQIKSAQDQLLTDYADDCVQDVANCLSQNNYNNNRTSAAINACKPLIKSCMSVTNENSTTDPDLWAQYIMSESGEITVLERSKNCTSTAGATWDSTKNICTCPESLVENALGKCVSRQQLACENSTGTWNEGSSECMCTALYTPREGICVLNEKINCETTLDEKSGGHYFAGTWTQNVITGDWFCNCRDGYHLENGYCSPDGYSSCTREGLGTWNWSDHKCVCEHGTKTTNESKYTWCPSPAQGFQEDKCNANTSGSYEWSLNSFGCTCKSGYTASTEKDEETGWTYVKCTKSN